MARIQYIVRRLLLAILVLMGVSVVTFIIARLVPSNPAHLWAGPRASADQIEAARTKLGLDLPLYEQYFRYIRQVLRGDFGVSILTRLPIVNDLKKYLPATLELVFFSMFFTVVIGVPLGVLSAAWKDRWLDHVSRVFAVICVSVPVFWLALILQLVFARYLGLLPLGGRVSRDIALFSPLQPITGFYVVDALLSRSWLHLREAVLHLILPSLALSSYGIGLAIRMTRANMVEVLEEKYITAAWAAGLSRRTVYFRLALKNAIVPTLMVLGLTFVWDLTGAMLVEIMFTWPGLGTYLFNAVRVIDFPVVISITLVVTVFYVFTNLVLDLLQAAIDPRVSLE